jgi:bacteriorhodopsin
MLLLYAAVMVAAGLGFLAYDEPIHAAVALWSGGVYALRTVELFGGYGLYVDWVVSTPLMLVAVAATARAAPVGRLIAAQVATVVAGVAAALTDSLVWFLVGVVPAVWVVTTVNRLDVSPRLRDWVTVFWIVYPVIWVLGPGTGTLRPSTTATLFVVIPAVSKVGLGLLDLGRPVLRR